MKLLRLHHCVCLYTVSHFVYLQTCSFGHTLDHAIESFYLEEASLPELLHGEAVAIGMILAAYISFKQEKLPEQDLKEITAVIMNSFQKVHARLLR